MQKQLLQSQSLYLDVDAYLAGLEGVTNRHIFLTGSIMKTNTLLTTFALASTVLLAACASPDYGYGVPQNPGYPAVSSGQPAYGTSYGVVDAIEMTAPAQSGIGAGTVIGGILGGVLGNQVGGGTGNTLATVAGVVGGAVAGNQLEKNTNQRPSGYNVRVRLDNGSYQSVTQDNVSDLRIGDRVRIENGRVYRY